MAYEIVSERPAVKYRNNGLWLLESRNLGQGQLPCPPVQVPFDWSNPALSVNCGRGGRVLCDAILEAIELAKNAASKLETKPLPSKTVDKFRSIFGQDPGADWEIPWVPRRKKPAGVIVANRFRIVANELRTRDTVYRCLLASRCTPSGGTRPEEPALPTHPTDTIVRDPVAWAVLCKDEVWLCPRFWTQPPEERAGTILHEMFHLRYGLTCQWFQHDGKEKKRNSAYCYEALALSLAGKSLSVDLKDQCNKTSL
jgi:hypothetical protein